MQTKKYFLFLFIIFIALLNSQSTRAMDKAEWFQAYLDITSPSLPGDGLNSNRPATSIFANMFRFTLETETSHSLRKFDVNSGKRKKGHLPVADYLANKKRKSHGQSYTPAIPRKAGHRAQLGHILDPLRAAEMARAQAYYSNETNKSNQPPYLSISSAEEAAIYPTRTPGFRSLKD
jgi:hypothetical protein